MTRKRAQDLGEQLFELVERDQGYAYISDAIEGWSRGRLMDLALDSARAHERCAQKLRRWERKQR